MAGLDVAGTASSMPGWRDRGMLLTAAKPPLSPSSGGCLARCRPCGVGRRQMRQGSPNQRAHHSTNFRLSDFASSIKLATEP
ncbi:hypothetical protein, partial [Paracraurococcus lichenis]